MPLDRYRNAAVIDGVDIRSLPVAEDAAAAATDVRPASSETQPVSHWLDTGVVKDATGSAYMESGDTKVLCSVHGPFEPKRSVQTDAGAEQSRAQLQAYYKLAPFASRRPGRISYQPEEAERQAAIFLQETLAPCLRLDRLPKSRIEVHCLVLDDAGGCLATAVNCACLALVNAGFEMYDLVAAATVYRPVGTAGAWSVDLGSAQPLSHSSVTVAYMRNLRQVAGLMLDAVEPLQSMEVDAACRLCLEPCSLMLETLRAHLLDGLPPVDADGDERMA